MLAPPLRPRLCLRSALAHVHSIVSVRQVHRPKNDNAIIIEDGEADKGPGAKYWPSQSSMKLYQRQGKTTPQHESSAVESREHRIASTKTISLLEQLFPEDMQRSRSRDSQHLEPPKPIREIPSLPLAIDFNVHAHSKTPAPAREDERSPALRSSQQSSPRDSNVLVLRNAGKLLTEDDFRRARPVGEHLEGWTSGGEGMKVIRGRDAESMQPDGNYYLLFRTTREARAYLVNAHRLHSLSVKHSPSTHRLTGPIPPPPMPFDSIPTAAHQHPRSTHMELLSYTLLPPFLRRIYIRQPQHPIGPYIRQLIENGGYEPLVRGRKTAHEVLLRVEGTQPTLASLCAAIEESGHERGLAWELFNDENCGVREVQLPLGAISDSGLGDSINESLRTSAAHVWRIWIVSFELEGDARRFVASWHQRDIGPLLQDEESTLIPQDEPVICKAEYIW